MEYFDTWRTNLKAHLAEFAPLAKEDRSINLIYGITAAAVLWDVRDAPFDDQQKFALKEACGDEKHLPHLVRAVGGWDAMTQLEAARSLSKRQRDSDELRDALTSLLGTFIEELFEQNMVQHQHIDISGSIIGGNIVIGGYQIVAGDMVIQYITQQKIRACPTAPKPPVHFAGRRDELNRLKEVLGQGQSVAITGIQGVGGIGKTALSLQLANEMSEFSAVLWASLGPNPNTGSQLIEWARHADPDFDPGQDDIDMLANRVQALLTNLIQEQCPGRVLVILDDIWEGDSVRAARTLQKAAPTNSVSLITTRSQLVVAQLRSTRLELQPMTPADALQMLRNLLSDYPDIPDDQLLELAEVVGHHPLAMELAAGQVTLLERPVQQISEQIERYRGGIPEGSPFRDIGLELGEDREDNLEVVLSFSYDSLTEMEQAQFRALGVLAYNAPFDREICRAIWGADPKSALDSLRHRALLGIAEGNGWYYQHVLLRSYARALVRSQDKYDIIFHRYADYIIHFAQQFDELPLEQWGSLEPQLPHLHSVGDELVKHYDVADQPRDNLVLRIFSLAWNSTSYLTRRPEALFVTDRETHEPSRIRWLVAGMECCETDQQKAILLNNIGGLYDALGEYDKALDYYSQALPLSRQEHDTYGESVTLNNIGMVYDLRGEKNKALDYYSQALRISQKTNDTTGMATKLNNIGMVYSTLGEKKKALDYFRKALHIVQQVNHKHEEATILNNMGTIYMELDDKDIALDHFQRVIPLRRQVNDKSGEATTLDNIGSIYFALGEKDKALDYYQNALSLSQQVGDKSGEATTLNNLGKIYSELGEKDKALDYYQSALLIFSRLELPENIAAMNLNIATVFIYNRNIQSAIEYLKQAIQVAELANLDYLAGGTPTSKLHDYLEQLIQHQGM